MSRADKAQRRRKRMEKRNSRRQASCFVLDISANNGILDTKNRLTLSYDITPDPLPEASGPAVLNLDDDTRQEIFELTSKDPQRAIERINALLEANPDAPMLLNWLHAAYGRAGDTENCDRVAERNYQANPDYLFAKLNFASACLARGDLDRVKEVFDGKFDLKLLYPHRDVFHVTEFLGFAAILIQYFMRTNQPAIAVRLYEVLEEIAPEYEITQSIREVMQGHSLLMLAQKLASGMLARGSLP